MALALAALLAQDGAADQIDDESILSAQPHADTGALEEPRVPPDYDGREPEWSPSPAVWPARVVLFPFYAVHEVVLRKPIGLMTRWIDHDNVATRVREALTFRQNTIGIFPVVVLSNGMRPGIGLSMFADRLFIDEHVIRAAVATDFQHNVTTSLLNRFMLGPADLDVRIAYQRRNDLVFYGIGSHSQKDDQTRFERRKPLAEIELVTGAARRASPSASSGMSAGNYAINDPSLGQATHFGGRLGIEVSDNNFDCTTRTPDICGADGVEATADDLFTLGKDGNAAYFESGYALLRLKALFTIDTRNERRPETTGVRLDVFGRYGQGLGERARDARFIRYGGELSGLVDVSGGRRRTLAARLFVELLEHVDGSDVPFAELITLGGPEVMRGFLRARFHGESAAVATLEYRWPIWSFLDANLFYDWGNVFGRHLADFDLKQLRGGYGLALRTNTSRDISFQILLALGTRPWSLAPSEFSTMIGTNLGF